MIAAKLLRFPNGVWEREKKAPCHLDLGLFSAWVMGAMKLYPSYAHLLYSFNK
jgi:hypothetical protein